MNKEIKLILTDLDGTLLYEEESVGERNKQAIYAAIKAGVGVVPITGRSIGEIPKDVREIAGIEYVAVCNGSQIYRICEGKEELVYSDVMETETVKSLFADFKAVNAIIHASVGRETFLDGESVARVGGEAEDDARGFMSIYGGEIADLLTLLVEGEKEAAKMCLIFCTPEERVEGWHMFKKRKDVQVMTSGQCLLDFNSVTSGKDAALRHFSKMFEIPVANIMAIGDNFNDLKMIEAAGVGVAMGNADEALKKAADFVTGTNKQSGVAMAIEKALAGASV